MCAHPTGEESFINMFFPKLRQQTISQLPNLFIGTPRICNFILLLIVWVRSFSKMLPSGKFSEHKVLFFVILREKC